MFLATAGLVLLAAGSSAPRVAVHPLTVSGADARVADEARSDFLIAAAAEPIDMVSRGHVAEVLQSQPGASCVGSAACVRQLSAETKARFVLMATLALDGPQWLLTATVFATNGEVVRSIESLAIDKDQLSARAPQLQAAFKRLFTALDLATLSASEPKPSPVAAEPQAEPARPPPAVTEPTIVARSSAPSTRIAGFAAGGAAIAAGVAGLALAGSAYSDSGKLRQRFGAASVLPDANAALMVGDVDRRATIAAGLLIGAGLVAATSIILLMLGRDSPAQLSLVSDSAQVQARWSF